MPLIARLLFTFAPLAAILASPAQAQTVFTLDFEGLQDQEQVLEFYNGGTGSLGSSGPDYGVSFSPEALALIDQDAGGSGNFANEPSPDTDVFFLEGSSVVMNVAAGFTTGFSFFYSSSASATVVLYDGLNATGNVVAQVELVAQFDVNCSGDPTGDFCNYTPIGVPFSGTVRSVDFGGTANQVGFDNITFGRDVPTGAPAARRYVPVPVMPLPVLLLMVAVVAGLGGRFLKRRH
jgi:hypothetical protein